MDKYSFRDINDTILKRLVDEKEEDLVQRADDTEEVVVKRLETYHNQTAPVLDYYKAQNKVTEIDGTKKLEDITQDIFKILG
mgnify:CR=1 FL=1